MFGVPGSGGLTWFYWKPEKRLRLLGWKNRALGSDSREAKRAAESLNAQINSGAAVMFSPRLLETATAADVVAALKAGHVDMPLTTPEEVLAAAQCLINQLSRKAEIQCATLDLTA